MNNAGIIDIVRALHISINAVVRALKNFSPVVLTTLPLDKLKIVLLCEVDEIWSFVMGIAHAFGDRSTETLNVLLMRMK